MPRTSKTNAAFESKLRSVVHPCPGFWVATGRAVVYYAHDAHRFNADIECGYCTYNLKVVSLIHVFDNLSHVSIVCSFQFPHPHRDLWPTKL